jgi:copper transport protein
VGRVWAVRLVLLAAVAVAARAFGRRRSAAGTRAGAERADDEVLYVGALLGLGVLATVSFAGHAASGDLVPLALVTDVVHLAGVSAWLGGLAMLLVAVLRRPPAPDGAADSDGATDSTDPADVARLDRVVGRFSSLAFGAVVAIVASGVVQAWRQLGSFAALVDTAYGRLLVAKVVLVALMLAGAAASRAWVQAHVGAPAGTTAPAPALSPGPGAAAAGSGTGRDLGGIRRSVGAEALLAVAVLAVTAGLVNAVPGETAQAGEGFAAEMHGTDVLVEAEVEPAEAGPVDVTVRALDHDGTPLDPEEVTASLSLPERELGPLDLTLEERGAGEFASTGAELPFPGEWELEVVVRTTDIDQDRLSTLFTVR